MEPFIDSMENQCADQSFLFSHSGESIREANQLTDKTTIADTSGWLLERLVPCFPVPESLSVKQTD